MLAAMNLSKVSRAELIGIVAAAILVLALFLLNWYDLTENPARDSGEGFVCGIDKYECTGWETFPILRWLLLAAALAPPILTWVVIRSHKLSWAPGEMTMVVGFIAFVLIAYNGIIDRPGSGTAEIGVGLEIGYWVGLAAAAGISASGIGRSMEERKGQLRKAPGTV